MVCELPDPVDGELNLLLADGVVPPRVVVRRILRKAIKFKQVKIKWLHYKQFAHYVTGKGLSGPATKKRTIFNGKHCFIKFVFIYVGLLPLSHQRSNGKNIDNFFLLTAFKYIFCRFYLFSRDQLLRMKKLSICSRSNLKI